MVQPEQSRPNWYCREVIETCKDDIEASPADLSSELRLTQANRLYCSRRNAPVGVPHPTARTEEDFQPVEHSAQRVHETGRQARHSRMPWTLTSAFLRRHIRCSSER